MLCLKKMGKITLSGRVSKRGLGGRGAVTAVRCGAQ